MSKYEISLSWQNKDKKNNEKNNSESFTYESYDRDHYINFGGNQKLLNSASPEYLGSKSASNPEELLAAALASCHMLTFLAIASKSGYAVASFTCKAEAILAKKENGKIAVTEINLYPAIGFIGEKIPDKALLEKMHAKSHANCFIAQSIQSKVNIF